jgi:xylulose-5-phosphate/fructose-6-phosphate phosphoketolase
VLISGFLQGYTITGRTAIFPSYESFLGIINTMVVQYSKFNKRSREIPWRKDLNSINYIETATWARQEHNGFSHQNPGFIGTVLSLKPEAARVYFPPDANCFLSTLAHCLRSKNYVNLIVSSEIPQPVWLSPEEAESHCRAGASVWKFASTDEGLDPDVVLVGIGSEVSFEVLKAAAYLRDIAPSLRIRVVNVTDLMILGKRCVDGHPHALADAQFHALFTEDRPIHFNYHGYVHDLQGLLFGRRKLDRLTIEGYHEEGTTATPFDMLMRNRVSRFHVAQAAVSGAAERNPTIKLGMHEILSSIQHDMKKVQDSIVEIGEGMQLGFVNGGDSLMDSLDPVDIFDLPEYNNIGSK